MKQHYVIRIIDGVKYHCLDTACPDFDRAVQNREMVKNKEHILGYLQIEEAVSHTPLDQPLPKWIPLGELPELSKGEKHNFSGGQTEDEDNLYWEVVVNQKHLRKLTAS